MANNISDLKVGFLLMFMKFVLLYLGLIFGKVSSRKFTEQEKTLAERTNTFLASIDKILENINNGLSVRIF